MIDRLAGANLDCSRLSVCGKNGGLSFVIVKIISIAYTVIDHKIISSLELSANYN